MAVIDRQLTRNPVGRPAAVPSLLVGLIIVVRTTVHRNDPQFITKPKPRSVRNSITNHVFSCSPSSLPSTVLQECATDSEELIYPVRAPSACSAPPDLLLTSDREQMLKVKSSKQHQQQSSHNHQSSQQQQQNHHKNSGMAGGQQQQQQHNGKESSFRKCSGRTPTVKSDPDRVRLEVSLYIT